MTVAELIEELRALSQDLPVVKEAVFHGQGYVTLCGDIEIKADYVLIQKGGAWKED